MLRLEVSIELQYREVTSSDQGPVVCSFDHVNVP
jgi:hypothetical protein